jgi:hypothetical protein
MAGFWMPVLFNYMLRCAIHDVIHHEEQIVELIREMEGGEGWAKRKYIREG